MKSVACSVLALLALLALLQQTALFIGGCADLAVWRIGPCWRKPMALHCASVQSHRAYGCTCVQVLVKSSVQCEVTVMGELLSESVLADVN